MPIILRAREVIWERRIAGAISLHLIVIKMSNNLRRPRSNKYPWPGKGMNQYLSNDQHEIHRNSIGIGRGSQKFQYHP